MKSSPSPNQAGFTLIELVIVASLTVLVMMTVTAMFMTFIITSQKASMKQKIQSEGESALSKIEFILRNSRKLVPSLDGVTTCNNDVASPMTSLAVQGLDGYVTTLQTYPLVDPKIASYSSAINDYYYLTSDEVTLSNLRFTCLNGAEDSFYINVAFDLKMGTGTTNDKETSIQNFQTGITLRNN